MDVRLILVLVLGRPIVYGQNTVYLCLSKYSVFENTHTHIATATSETEGVAAVSCLESRMNRRPLGSIDANSIRETELHTESRRRLNRGEREFTPRPRRHRERDAACQRAAATRRRETDEARAEGCGRTDKEKLRGASRRQHKRERRGVCVSVLGVSMRCLLYTSPSPRDLSTSRMPSSA